jgi:hypothetical protein
MYCMFAAVINSIQSTNAVVAKKQGMPTSVRRTAYVAVLSAVLAATSSSRVEAEEPWYTKVAANINALCINSKSKVATACGNISEATEQKALVAKKAVQDALDPYWNGNEITEAKELRGTALSKYPGVYQDTRIEELHTVQLPSAIKCRHFEATRDEPSPLFVYILGNRQSVDDQSDTELLQAYYAACRSNNHAIVIESGVELARVRGRAEDQADVRYQHMLNCIESKIDPEKHSEFMPFAYSKGAGMLCASLENNGNHCDLQVRTKAVPVNNMYVVDPIKPCTVHCAKPVPFAAPYLQQTQLHWYYQNDGNLSELLNPLVLTGSRPTKTHSQVRVEKLANETHESIDAAIMPRFISVIAEINK